MEDRPAALAELHAALVQMRQTVVDNTFTYEERLARIDDALRMMIPAVKKILSTAKGSALGVDT